MTTSALALITATLSLHAAPILMMRAVVPVPALASRFTPFAPPARSAALVNAPLVVMQAVAAPEPSGAMGAFQKFSNVFSNMFPVWTLTVAILGLTVPAVFAGISTSSFTALLGMLMLSMGITLTIDDFKRVLQVHPRPETTYPTPYTTRND